MLILQLAPFMHAILKVLYNECHDVVNVQEQVSEKPVNADIFDKEIWTALFGSQVGTDWKVARTIGLSTMLLFKPFGNIKRIYNVNK